MKKLWMCILMLVLVGSVSGSVIFSVDFESGLTANAGVNSLEPASPTSLPTNVTLVGSSDVVTGNGGNVVQVGGNTSTYSYLNYDVAGYTSMPSSGTLDLDFYCPSTWTAGRAWLFSYKATNNSGEYMQVGFGRPTQFVVRSNSYTSSDSGQVNAIANPAAPSVGWHHLRLEWTETAAFSDPVAPSTTGTRGTVDLRAYIDDVLILSVDDQLWTRSGLGMSNFTIGAGWQDMRLTGAVSSVADEAYDKGVLIDNVVVTPEPATLLLIAGGALLLGRKKGNS